MLGLAASLFLVMGLSRETAGHAVPVAAEPAENAVLAEAPHEVVIRFSERVDARSSSLEVLDGRGQRLHHGDAVVDPADPWRYRVAVHGLTAGAYTVAWRVLSADDGHVTHGAHVFAVGADSAPGVASPVVIEGSGFRSVARWLVVLGGALLLGVPITMFWLGSDVGAARPTASLPWLGGAMIVVGGSLDLGLQAWDLAGERPVAGVLRLLLFTRSGHVWLFRALALILLAALWAPTRVGGRWRRLTGLLLGGAVVISGGLLTHSATVVDGRALALGLEALHLVAMAAWVGGLVGFGSLLWHTITSPAAAVAETKGVALAIPAFSGLAIPAVGTLAISGLALARLHLTAWDELIRTPYGRWLLAKLLVFAAMLALAAYHQQRVHRRLRDAVAGGRDDGATVSRFRHSLRIEAGLGVVALLFAAVLASTSPAPPAVAGASSGFRLERSFEAARVRLDVTPLRPGPNTIHVTVTDPAGRPLTDATGALVQLVPAAGGVGPVTFPLVRTGPGVFTTPEAVLGIVGRWDGRLVIQREGAYDVNDRFELTLADRSSVAPHHTHGRALPLDTVTAWSTAGITLATAALWVAGRRTRRATRRLVADADRVQPDRSHGGLT